MEIKTMTLLQKHKTTVDGLLGYVKIDKKGIKALVDDLKSIQETEKGKLIDIVRREISTPASLTDKQTDRLYSCIRSAYSYHYGNNKKKAKKTDYKALVLTVHEACGGIGSDSKLLDYKKLIAHILEITRV